MDIISINTHLKTFLVLLLQNCSEENNLRIIATRAGIAEALRLFCL